MASMFHWLEETPSNPSDGMCWFKASNATVYMYLNGGWHTYATGGDSVTYRVGLNVFINGVDRTDNIDVHTYNKTDNLTFKVDTLEFDYWDDDNDARPIQGEEIITFWKTTSGSTPVKDFGGEILNVPQREKYPGASKYDYSVMCVDYSYKLKKELVAQTYESQTAKAMITDIVDTYAPELSYNNVETGLTLSYQTFARLYPDECIKRIALDSGYDWYVDVNRDIHFFTFITNPAPYDITDDITTSGSYENLVIDVDKSQYKNRVIVQGGHVLSGDYPDIQEIVDNAETQWRIAYKPFVADSGNVEVYIDSGAGYVAKTLGIQNIHTSGYDFLLNQNEKTIKALDYSANAGDLLKLVYKFKAPIVTQDDDKDSQDTIIAIEGGRAIYGKKIVDKNIRTLQAAHDRASAYLGKYANPLVTGSFRTKDSGYRSGQLLTVNATSRGTYATSKTYLIQTVSMIILDKSIREWNITFATRLKGWVEFLAELYDNSALQEIIIRNDETLDKLRLLTKETITITETTRTDKGLPYEWMPGGDRSAQWNAARTTIDSTTAQWG